MTAQWWRDAVVYQVYPRSFADGNDDGIGDLIGVRERLHHVADLGADAVWLSPFYRSPMADGGYDVADPCDVDPVFGTLADFDAMLEHAHSLDLKVIVDLVPNHFSSEHPWFEAALAAAPGSPERARFYFRDGRGARGELPPNNWPSLFGGSAWTRVDDGQWYLHIFAAEQPDLDWTNEEVRAEFDRIIRFWLERGVDGFRIDVAHGMAKPPSLPDMDPAVLEAMADGVHMPSFTDPRFDNDGVHELHARFRRVVDEYDATHPGERMLIGEAWVPDDERLARYVRPDELHLTFNFELTEAKWGADSFRTAIRNSLTAMSEAAAPCTWVLGNHDVDRPVTRFGGGAIGLARARAAALVQLALPGAAYIYNGDELGLANVDLPDAALRDPTWERSGHTIRGRDGERVPVPWSGDAPPFGFCESADPWLPMPSTWAGLTVAAQTGASQTEGLGSTLELFRAALRLRRGLAESFTWVEMVGVESGGVESGGDVLAFRRGDVTVLLNAGSKAVPLPAGEIVLASGPASSDLPGNTTVWLRTT